MSAAATVSFLLEANRAGVGRMFALPKGRKSPPPRGVTGGAPVLSGEVAKSHAAAALARVEDGGNAGLRLSPGWFAADIDTKNMGDDEWALVADVVEDALGGLRPHNTTLNAWFHGHYIFREPSGGLPACDGLLWVNGVRVGDVIRTSHRYLATGRGYECVWYPPRAAPAGVLAMLKLKPVARRVTQVNGSRAAARFSLYRGRNAFDPRGLASPVGEGGRHAAMCSVAGIILTKDNADVGLLHEQNQQRCRPPLPDAEIEHIWAGLTARRSGSA